MPESPVLRGYLDEVGVELDAVEKLSAPPLNRLAAFHLQQTAKKLTKAVRLHRGLPATAEHRIGILLGDLSETDPWRSRLDPLDRHSQYATTYRYPSGAGRVKLGPSEQEIAAAVTELRALLAVARAEL